MRKILHPLKRLWWQSEGSVTVEFIINVPVLLFALVFVFEFGRAFFAYEALTADVEAALRYLSRVSDCATLSATGSSAINAQNLAQCGTLPAQGTASPTNCASTAFKFPWNSSSSPALNVTPDVLVDSTNFNSVAHVVQVQAAVPLNLFFLPYIGLGANHTLVVGDQARCVGN